MDAIDKLARRIADLHKENRNPPSTAPKVGEVISVQPLRIKYGESIILESRHLIVADHVMNGYQRQLELTGASSDGGNISFHLTGSPPPQDYTITNLSLPNLTATLTYTDRLKAGDKVIMIPETDLKTWFVIDRVWQGGESS